MVASCDSIRLKPGATAGVLLQHIVSHTSGYQDAPQRTIRDKNQCVHAALFEQRPIGS